MDQNNTEPTLESLIGRPGPPPLRIHHIMVATAVTAVFLTLGRSLHQVQVAGVNLSGSFESPAGAFHAVLIGIAITLIGFGFAWRRIGFAFPCQPGHWLLLNTAVSLIFYAALAFAQLLTWSGVSFSTGTFLGCYGLLSLAAVIAINAMAAWRTTDSRAWRVYFVAHCVLFVVSQFLPIVLSQLLGFRTARIGPYVVSSLIVSGCLTFFIFAAIGTDLRLGRTRDWVHWIGVALTLLSMVVGIITAAVQLWVSVRGGP